MTRSFQRLFRECSMLHATADLNALRWRSILPVLIHRTCRQRKADVREGRTVASEKKHSYLNTWCVIMCAVGM